MEEVSSQSPNIIIICADQHRADTIGSYGSTVCCTPALDRLAAQGVQFNRCYANNPVCAPSRATILTGLQSTNHGLLRNGYELSRQLPTLASTMQQHGYHTHAIGKLHLSPQEHGVDQAPYYGSVSFMDNAIGHLLSAAEAALNMENTIVIYLADHGEVLGDHHFKGKWLYHYESSNRVPLIWRHDNHCQAGTNRHEFVELCDFTPTVLAAAGIATDNKMDGRSYLPLLQGIPIPDWRDHAYSESCNYLAATTDTPETIFWPRTIRSANYRCTFNTDPAVGELYNLHQDPDESCNLFHNPAYRGVIEEHRQRLESRGFIFKTPPPPRPYNV